MYVWWVAESFEMYIYFLRYNIFNIRLLYIKQNMMYKRENIYNCMYEVWVYGTVFRDTQITLYLHLLPWYEFSLVPMWLLNSCINIIVEDYEYDGVTCHHKAAVLKCISKIPIINETTTSKRSIVYYVVGLRNKSYHEKFGNLF